MKLNIRVQPVLGLSAARLFAARSQRLVSYNALARLHLLTMGREASSCHALSSAAMLQMVART